MTSSDSQEFEYLAVGVGLEHDVGIRHLEEGENDVRLPAITYAEPTIIIGGTPVKAAHVDELRQGVQSCVAVAVLALIAPIIEGREIPMNIDA